MSVILGVVVAAALMTGLNAISQPGRQILAEKAALPSTPPAPSIGGAYNTARDRIEVATAPSLWQFLPPFLVAVVAAFAVYAFARFRLG